MNANSRSVKPAWFHFLFGGGFLWLVCSLWVSGQAGNDLAAIGAAILGFFAALQFLHGIVATFTYWRRRGIERRASMAGTGHGRARLASLKDVRKAGMLERDGIFLGSLDGRDLYYPGETHLLTIAPPGAGKGACMVVPNLLLCNRSMIVTDPKGELWAMTARHREEVLGHRVMVLCPWADKMGEELGMAIPDHRFNPYSGLKIGPDLKDEIELRSNFALPSRPNMDASSEFFVDGGQSMLTGVTAYLVEKFGSVDPPLLRSHLFQPPERMFEMLDEMAESDALDGAVREIGGQLLGTLKDSGPQFAGILGSAQKALRIYDASSPLGKHVSHGEIDFASFKEIPTTLYIIMPSDRASTHAAWLNMVVSLAMELVGRDRSNRRVTFLLDEFANMYLPNVLRSMAQYRGQGVQCFCQIQQISQLERLYSRSGMREFLGMSEIVNTFGVWEPDTLDVLSKWMGSRTARQFGQNVTPGVEDGRFGFNYQASDYGAPLMRTEDIRTMRSDEQLIFYRNLPPIKARKVSYLERKSLRKLADPNPYYRMSHE